MRDQSTTERMRDRILRELLAATHGATATEMAEVVGVHRPGAAHHLRALVAGEQARATTPSTGGRGRPSTVFVATDPDPYRTLAGWLATTIDHGADARRTGRSIGGALADAATSGRPDGHDTVTLIGRLAAHHGFTPAVEPGDDGGVDVVLGTCPYVDIATQRADVVCALHLGLAEGIAARTKTAEVVDLTVTDPVTAGCRIRLRPISG
jgi:predicted ArsR family transcriptional regulator